MFAEALLLFGLTVLCFVAGVAGGRRILSSAMAPGILVVLGFVGNHSDLVDIPPSTRTLPLFGWLFGVLLYLAVQERRSASRGAAGEQEADAAEAEHRGRASDEAEHLARGGENSRAQDRTNTFGAAE